MKSLMNDVADFHKACGVPILDAPQFPDWKRQALRMDLHDEEHKELKTAVALQDMEKIADALGDIIYIAVGTALEYGIPLDTVWQSIQKSNMAKADPETGAVRRRVDGKILKPEGWQPPDIMKCLLDAGYEAT